MFNRTHDHTNKIRMPCSSMRWLMDKFERKLFAKGAESCRTTADPAPSPLFLSFFQNFSRKHFTFSFANMHPQKMSSGVFGMLQVFPLYQGPCCSTA